MLNPVFLARNRMVTRVVAKQAKTKKVKNEFVNGKKKFKGILSCLFRGRLKVQLRRKRLGDKVQAKIQICLVGSVANSVGTPLEFAAFRNSFDAKYSRVNDFFSSVHNHGFAAVRTHFARKNTSIFMLTGSVSRRKK